MAAYLTDAERKRLIDRLHAEGCSCVIRNGVQTRLFHERGVKDLYRLLNEEPALMIAGGVREVYADVISTPALELFTARGVRVVHTQEVPHIINRSHTGLCPVETLCRDCRTAEECLEPIREFIERC